MLRLTVITCVVLGTALARSGGTVRGGPLIPLSAERGGPLIPLAAKSLSYYDKLPPIDAETNGFEDILPTGNYSFASWYYPDRYPNFFDISVTVRGDNDQDVSLSCADFEMEDCECCGCDFLSVNGQKYCGTDGPPLTTASELELRVKSNRQFATTGFDCLVTVA